MRVELREEPDDEEVKASRMDPGVSEDQAIERIKHEFDAEDLTEPDPEEAPEPKGAGH